MQIKQIHITSFGPLRDRDFTLAPGLNIFEGANESGKSSIAMFLKFMLYGLSGRGSDGEMAERRKYPGWDTGRAAGSVTVCCRGKEYRIERELYVPVVDADATALKETLSVTDTETGERVFKNQVPGVALLGMTEQMFLNSVFVRQLGDTRIDGTGMTEAIENILLSGDEGLNIKRATALLDRERKALLHKNGGGGKIYELKQEQSRMESQREAASADHSELIALEDSIADSSAMIEERTRKAAQLSSYADAYDTLRRGARLDAALACCAEAERRKAALVAYAPYGDIGAKLQEIAEHGAAITGLESQLRTLRRALSAEDDALPRAMTPAEEDFLREEPHAARRALRGRRGAFAAALCLFILAAVAGCAAVFLRQVEPMVFYAALALSGVAAIFGAVAFGVSLSRLKKYHKILGTWGAADITALSDAIEHHIALAGSRRDPSSRYGILHEEVAAAEAEQARETAALRAICAQFTPEVPDTDLMAENAVTAAKVLQEEIARATEQYHTAAGQAAAFRDVLEPAVQEKIRAEVTAVQATEAGKIAAGFRKEDADKARLDAGFYRSSVDSQKVRHLDLVKRQSALQAVTTSPAVLAEKAAHLRTTVAALQEEHDAIRTAMDALETAAGNLRASLMPRLMRESGLLFGMLSAGKYPTVAIGTDFTMRFVTDGRTRELDYLSAGTQDAAYLSLRYALQAVLFPENPPPMVLDESFARIDAERLERFLAMLSAAGERGCQSLLFTCRTLEGELAANLQNGENMIHNL